MIHVDVFIRNCLLTGWVAAEVSAWEITITQIITNFLANNHIVIIAISTFCLIWRGQGSLRWCVAQTNSEISKLSTKLIAEKIISSCTSPVCNVPTMIINVLIIIKTTRSYAALWAADLDWIVPPGYSLGRSFLEKNHEKPTWNHKKTMKTDL